MIQLNCLIIEEEFNFIYQLLLYSPICNNHSLSFHKKIFIHNLKFLQLEKMKLSILKILQCPY
ncbi:hypothetical protein AMTRI_Chr09g16830 [Amborella trichopoda]